MLEIMLSGSGGQIILPDELDGNSFNTNKPIGVETHAIGACVLGNDIYTYGGSTAANLVSTFQRYNCQSLTWSSALSSSPGVRSGPAMETLNGLIYMHGGAISATTMTNELWVYTPSTNTWTKSTSTPPGSPRYYHGHAALGGKIYYFGGTGASSTQYNGIYSYDPATNGWAILATMDLVKHGMGTAASESLIYTFGGLNGATVQANLHVYDPVANTYTKITPVSTSNPSARVYPSLIYYQGSLYMFGGLTSSSGGQVNDFWRYDIAANTWTQITLTGSVPSVRGVSGTAIWRNQLHVIGGLGPSTTRLKDHFFIS